jgi:hypothetical protein
VPRTQQPPKLGRELLSQRRPYGWFELFSTEVNSHDLAIASNE